VGFLGGQQAPSARVFAVALVWGGALENFDFGAFWELRNRVRTVS